MGSIQEKSSAGNCASCPFARGVLVGGRIGYDTGTGFFPELTLGILFASSNFEQRLGLNGEQIAASQAAPSFIIQNILGLKGYFAGPSAGYALELNATTKATFRAMLGIMSAQSYNDLPSGETRRKGVYHSNLKFMGAGSDSVLQSAPPFLWPEIGIEKVLNAWRIGASLGILLLLDDGPPFLGRGFDSTTDCSSITSIAVDCAPILPLSDNGYGKLQVLWTPRISIGYAF